MRESEPEKWSGRMPPVAFAAYFTKRNARKEGEKITKRRGSGSAFCGKIQTRVGERLRILGIGVFGLAFLLIFILILGGAVRRITCNVIVDWD